MATSSDTAIPLLIGVTGHREIDPNQRQPLQDAVVALLRELRAEYPSTPLVLLSPLAGDADRLIVEATLQVDSTRFIAVLPWPTERDDEFDTPDNERGRCPLVGRATQVVVMPMRAVDDAMGDSVTHQRERQFDAVGRYIARHCQILIAAWDGDPAASSKTARVIKYHAEGAPAPFAYRAEQLDTIDQSAVCEFRVRRHASDAPEVGECQTIGLPRWTWPDVEPHDAEQTFAKETGSQRRRFREPPREDAPYRRQWRSAEWVLRQVRRVFVGIHRLQEKTAERVSHFVHEVLSGRAESSTENKRRMRQRWRAIDRFNRDAARLLARHAEEVARSRQGLIPDSVAAGLSPCVLELRAAFAVADTVAGKLQTWRWWIVLLLFVLALVAVACLEVHAHLWFDPAMLKWYLALLVCGYVLYRLTRWLEHQGRWLDSRALAEALRVQVFWRWAGKEQCAADHYLRSCRGDLEWIRHALRAHELMAGGHQPVAERPLGASCDELRAIGERWVSTQQMFFAKNAPLNEELAVSFHTGTQLMLVAALVLAVLQILLQHDVSHPLHGLVLATFSCLLIAAMLEKFGEIHAYELLARRYRWMADLYQIAEERLHERLDAEGMSEEQIAGARDVLFELGCEALAENAEWVILYRQRPPVLPTG